MVTLSSFCYHYCMLTCPVLPSCLIAKPHCNPSNGLASTYSSIRTVYIRVLWWKIKEKHTSPHLQPATADSSRFLHQKILGISECCKFFFQMSQVSLAINRKRAKQLVKWMSVKPFNQTAKFPHSACGSRHERQCRDRRTERQGDRCRGRAEELLTSGSGLEHLLTLMHLWHWNTSVSPCCVHDSAK